MRRIVSALFLLLLLALPAVYADSLKEPQDAIAKRILSVYAEKGARGLKPLVTPESLGTTDAFRVAGRLLITHARAVLAEPPQTSKALDAAKALAALVGKRPEFKHLPRLVARWSRYDGAALQRELDLRSAYVSMARPRARRDWAAMARISEEANDLVKRMPYSTTAVDLEPPRLSLLAQAGETTACAEGYRTLGKRCIAMGWVRVAAGALMRAGNGFKHLGRYADASADFKEAVAIYERIGHPARAAYGLVELASVQRRQGNLDDAATLLQRAMPILRSEKDRGGEMEAAMGLGLLLKTRGRHLEAKGPFERALALATEIGDAHAQVVAHANIGNLLMDLMDFAAARAQFDTALSLAREKKTHTRLSLDGIRSNLANLHWRAGHHAEAMALLRDIVRNQEHAEETSWLAQALLGLGYEYNRIGKYADAVAAFERGAELSRTRGERAREAEASGGLATTYLHLGDEERALKYARRMLAIYRAMKAPRDEMRALRRLGEILRSVGRSDEALEHLQGAYEIARSSPEPALLALSASRLGAALLDLGRADEALPLLEAALKIAEESANPAKLLYPLSHLSAAYWSLDRHADAMELARRGAALSESVGDRKGLAEALEQLGHYYFLRKEYRKAAEASRRSVEIRLSLARGLGIGQATQVRVAAREGSELGLETIMWEVGKGEPGHRVETTRKQLEEALWFTEAGRSLALLEGVLNRDILIEARASKDALEKEGVARDRVRRDHHALIRLATASPQDPGALKLARKQLDDSYGQLEAALARVARETRSLQPVLDPRPRSLVDMQAALTKGEALLSYELMDGGQTVVFVITHDGAEWFRLGNTVDVRERTAAWRRLLRAPGTEDATAARALHDIILKPLALQLEGVTRLIIAPDDVLALVPFEALLEKHKGKSRRLIERFEVSYVPSGSFLALLTSTESGRGFLALGDPVYPGEATFKGRETITARGLGSLARIPATGEEVRSIAKLFNGKHTTVLVRADANREALETAIAHAPGRLRAVHLACHGFVDSERPMLTGLVLSQGETLTLADVYRLNVPADLVVLSACETGLGRITRAEGITGLTRGFFVAGVPRVVVSNWRVSDQSAKDLMVSFYRALIREKQGTAQALRAAKLIQLKGENSHPYHWAGFVLWGRSD